MTDICEKSLCTGCHACVNACGKKAISMQPDLLGFLYPQIDTSLCIDCGLCAKVCPVNHPPKAVYPTKVYAVQSNDLDDLMTSTSGGAASVFSQYIISQGGVVYGCSGSDITHISHKRIENHSDLSQLKGSKYVQSHIGLSFQQVRKDLKSGRNVLFIGTPCQIAGLKNFLGRDYDNLITIDLVCHGVPSQQLLLDELHRNKIDAHSDSLAFRKKGKSIKDLKYGIYVKHDNHLIYAKDYPRGYYIMGFMVGLFLRNSCYSCHWASPNRCSDITIGDFWGLGNLCDAKMDKGRGISEVMINTEKGFSFFEVCKNFCYFEERNLQEAIDGNGRFHRPSERHPLYFRFQQLYAKHGFVYSCRKCLRNDYKHYYISKWKRKLYEEAIKVPYARSIYRKLKRIFKVCVNR